MIHPIAQLEEYLNTLETNEPINRKEGKDDQAELQAVAASQTRQALAILRAADGGPIWPAPLTPPTFAAETETSAASH